MKPFILFLMILTLSQNSLALFYGKRNSNLHRFTITKENSGKHAHGSFTQNSTLLGKYRIDLVIGEAYGHPVLLYRFNWQWKSNFRISTQGHAISERDFKKYPDLYSELMAIKPLLVEFDIPVEFYNDTMSNQFKLGKAKLRLQVVDQQIKDPASDLSNVQTTWAVFVPSWQNIFQTANADFDTSQLRYIGKKIGDSLHRSEKMRAFSAEHLLSYAERFKISNSAIQIKNIRWPAEKIKSIYRRAARRMYDDFNSEQKRQLKSKVQSRADFARKLKQDADQKLFWNGVSIDVENTETYISSPKSLKLTKTIERIIAQQSIDRSRYDSLERIMDSNVSNFHNRLHSAARGEKDLPNITSLNLSPGYNTHLLKAVSFKAKLSAEPQKVTVIMNDVLSQQTRKTAYKTYTTDLLFNYGSNEIKTELKMNGLSLTERFFIKRSGPRLPFRATLFWDFDNSDSSYRKSDIDIALSENSQCTNRIVSYQNDSSSYKSYQLELDVDNREGFGPENISAYNTSYANAYVYICLKNHTNKVAATAKVVVFQDEIIQEIEQGSFVYEHRFSKYDDSEWIRTPNFFNLKGQ